MNNSSNRSVTIFFLLSVFVIVAAAGSRRGAALQASNVVVTNTTAQPVPVSLQGSATVKAVQSGTWLNYIYTTLPIMVKDMNNPAHDPFTIRVYPTAANSSNFFVPAGKRLILTQFSAFDNGAGTVQHYSLYTTSNGAGGALVIPVTAHGSPYSYAIQPISVEADGGSTVIVGVTDSNANDTAGINVDLHGYFVDYY